MGYYLSMTTFTIDRSYWAKLSIFEQMGNISSEVGRSFKTKNKTDREGAIVHATDLLNATIYVLMKSGSPRAKEVRLAKQEFLKTVSDEHASQQSIQDIERYFFQFALAARLQR